MPRISRYFRRSAVITRGMFATGNIGDDAMLRGFAALMQQCTAPVGVWCASADPRHSRRVEPSFAYYRENGFSPRRAIALRFARWYLVVGDTPIMDVGGPRLLRKLSAMAALAQQRGKTLAFLGVGTEELRAEESAALVRDCLVPATALWTVRSTRDAERLKGHGADPERIVVGADLAWLLDPVSPAFGADRLGRLGLREADDRPLIGVNVSRDPQPPDAVFEALAACLDRLVEVCGAQIVFLANEVRPQPKFDAATSRRVMDSMAHGDRAILVPNVYWRPDEMLSLIACCDATIGFRYHFCVFSAVQGVPVFVVERLGKLRDLSLDMEWEYSVPVEQFDQLDVTEHVEEMLRDRDELSRRLKTTAETMRHRARSTVPAINALFGE